MGLAEKWQRLRNPGDQEVRLAPYAQVVSTRLNVLFLLSCLPQVVGPALLLLADSALSTFARHFVSRGLGTYLRTRRKNADGSTAEYHQPAESVRDPAKVCAVAKVVYNFGRSEQIDREGLRHLAHSILRVFSGEEALAAEPSPALFSSIPGPSAPSTSCRPAL